MSKNINTVVKLTTNCPGNCICCANRKKEIKIKNESNMVFDISIFKKVCEDIRKMGATYICFSGGEPTIISNIRDYFEISYANNLAVRLNTNGWGITKENVTEWLSLGLEQIVLSVYSLNEKTMKQSRGNNLIYSKSINAANVIKEIKPKRGFNFIIQTVIMKDNYFELPKLLEFAIQNNADYFWPSYLEDAINLPGARMNKEDIILFKRNIIPEMKDIVDNKIINLTLREKLKHCIDNYYSDEYDGYIYHKDKFDCDWLGRHITLYPNGTVYPCPGHEYFSSECEDHLDYSSIDDYLKLDTMERNKQRKSIHCAYCPQGVHQELKLYI